MPHQERAFRRQKAVIWPYSGIDSNGLHTVGAPREITVRWNDVFKERTQPDGSTITISAEVVVDERVVIGSRMWLGKLIDLPSDGSQDWAQVVGYNDTKDIKNRAAFRTVSLMRLRQQNT